jgi:molybdate transport system substrate-binding protein
VTPPSRVLPTLLLAGAALALATPPASTQRAPVVAAAASVQGALEEVAARFGRDTGQQVRLTVGASGNLRRQIEQGAPFEVFLSADEENARAVIAAGHAQGEGLVYALGRLALFVPRGSPVTAGDGLAGLRRALSAGLVRRLAIANPEHAPYGRAAVEALRASGMWELARPRLVFGESAAQAAQFVASGNAEAGLIPWSLALSPRVAPAGDHALVQDDLHAPLVHRAVLLRRAGPVAREFYAFLGSPAAREIFSRHGLPAPPGAP